MTEAAQIEIVGTDQRAAWLAGELPAVTEIRAGIWSVPVVFPDNPLRYTLCYLIEDRDGPMLIDPGVRSDQGVAALTDALLKIGYRLGDIAGVAITHAHPDHHGMSAGVLAESDGWMAMHTAEAAELRDRTLNTFDLDSDAAWLRRYAVPADISDELQVSREVLRYLGGLALATRPLEDGEFLPLTDHRIRAVWTPGHTPGHLCYFDEGEQLFFSGDHILPRISPHIGLQQHRAASPLGPYLDSLRKVAVYDGAEVLPGHEWRFRGLAVRVQQLLTHHEHRCEEIVDHLDAGPGVTAWDLTTRLTWSRGWPAIQGFQRRSALAETIAHLEYLKQHGTVQELPATDERDARFVNVA